MSGWASEVWGCTVYAPSAARALGTRSHIVQVRVIGLARSRAEFARMLQAGDLIPRRLSASAASRVVANSGAPTGNVDETWACVGDTSGERVYVTPLDRGIDGARILAWPPKEGGR